jgi:putative flippase GtrA
LLQWLRHHLVAVVATAVDYVVMVALVELAGLRPVPATVGGALVGAGASFLLGRIYTYRVTKNDPLTRQAWRYVLVSAASLGWNAGGEYLFNGVLGLQYLLARFITSVLVSNAWNYPMQRFFVFSRHRTEPSAPKTT